MNHDLFDCLKTYFYWFFRNCYSKVYKITRKNSQQVALYAIYCLTISPKIVSAKKTSEAGTRAIEKTVSTISCCSSPVYKVQMVGNAGASQFLLFIKTNMITSSGTESL